MGVGARLARFEVEQDVGDPGRLRLVLDAGRLVGGVLVRGDARRLGVGGALRAGVDRGAGDVGRGAASMSAWIEISSAAPASRASRTRSSSETNSSPWRVRTTLKRPLASSRRCSSSAYS